MPLPSSAPTQSPVIQLSTVADSIPYPFWCQGIRWILTTDATSTWALAITQTTGCQPNTSTYAWPLVGSSTQAVYLGGSTAAVAGGTVVYFPVNNYVLGLAVPTITGGCIQVLKGVAPSNATVESTKTA